ncbi:hypothetical protein HBH98_204870 [Parastagonospora nodorum]|nr:hypothetical protein HBI09_191530 [Parastagonospora nodorum]KAH4339477.1 hypothetical protein HBH98_204870 [Parastagonospora nodorum]KAH4362383.1 hypothetical protein HBH97_193150 [Parastagonospora nodorum]KAH4379733.1 hypothetical protein HBH99_200750 [Parastagonospora nodorum]KAH4801229.1 hypothetical protein HBH61_198590 [Parastagonospora nodorum]
MSPPTSSPNFWQPLLSTIDNTPPWFSALPELLGTLYQLSKAIDCGYLRPRPVKRMVPDVVISAAIINRYPVYQWLVHGKTFSTSVVVLWVGLHLAVVALLVMAARARRISEECGRKLEELKREGVERGFEKAGVYGVWALENRLGGSC